MLERLKNLLKPAIKTIRFNMKRYVYFVILLIFIQSLISCIFMFNHNNNQNQVAYLEQEFQYEINGKSYPYYIVLNNLTDDQYNHYLQSESGVISTRRYFNHVYDRVTSSTGTSSRYYVYVNFYNDNRPDKTPYELYEMFLNRQEIKDLVSEEIVITQTPLLLAYRSSFVNTTVSSLIALLVTALGALTFGILFHTFINHYKFSYGVYMTYGANFKKLLSTSLTEMLILNFLTFVPSFLLSILIAYLLTASAGNGISILIYPMFLSLLCSIVLTVVAVTVVIKRISLFVPDKLLRSVNNESMITSPRRSVRLPEKCFPFRLEMLSMKRFRKYVITLLLTTLIFAGAFCGGTYLMEVRAAEENAKRPQFDLSFPTNSIYDTTAEGTSSETPETTEGEGEDENTPIHSATGQTYNATMRDILYRISGVEKIVKTRIVQATDTSKHSHILIRSSDLTWSGKTNGTESEESGYIGFANVNYTLFDEEVAEGLVYLGATITGDIQSVLNDKKTIAISDTLNNELMHKLEVGDTIRIVRSYTRRRPLSNVQPTSANHLLEMYYRAFDFYYAEYTVGAIISDMAVGENLPVYLNATTFEEVTGETPFFVDVDIYCADGVSEDTVRNMELELRNIGRRYNMSVSNTRQETVKETNKLKNYPGLILYISLLLLLIYILLTSLSQTLFYKMRKKELDIYLCLGVSFKQVRKLFWVDARFFALLSTIVYSFFATLSTWIVYYFVHSTSPVRVSFHIPLWAFIVGLVVVLLTSILSVMFAYLTFKRRSAPVFTGKAVMPAIGTEDLEARNEIFDSDAR